MAEDLSSLIADPPRDFSPTPLWWWSGEKVTRERVRWQLEQFAAGGIYGVVIINLAPAGPLVGARTDDPVWFSEGWWDRFADACEAASELGMKIWFYDQIGFSGANVQGRVTQQHPDAAGLALRIHRTPISNGVAQIPANERVLALFDDAGHRVALDADGRCDLADGSDVSLVTTVPTAFDYLSPRAAALLRDSIHGEFERRVGHYFGTVIAGSFQDELPATNMWTERFADEFQARKGYDLLDELPALWAREGDRAAKVRGDYYDVRGQLTEEAFFRPLGEWHTDRGMLVGSDQSNPARAGNPTQATQIYTDYMRTHRWYGAAGSDHEGDAKLHSSLAHLYGHEKVWIESFHSSGWGGTLEETWDWLIPFLRSGANLYNPHASYYSTRAGWFEWAPPSTDWRQPYWAQYPEFSRAVRRVASVCSWGSFVTSTAVLHPTANAQALLPLDLPVDHFGQGQIGEGFEALDAAQEAYLALVGANNWFHTRLGELDQAGISFDIIDDSSLQTARIDGDALRAAHTSYRTVVIPAATVLESATVTQLIALLDAGGRVIVVGRMPRLAAGLTGDDSAVQQLIAHPRIVLAADATSAVAEVGVSAEYVHSDVPVLTRRSGEEVVTFVPGALPNATAYPLREWDGPWLWDDIDFDRTRYSAHREVRVAGPVSDVVAIDAASGVELPVIVEHGSDSGSVIRVATGGSPAILVRWRAVASSEQTTDAAASVTRQVLAGPWRGRLVPTLDNRWGDFALPAGRDVSELEVWDIEVDEGTGWQPARATVGERVLSAIRPIGELPPLTAVDVSEICAGRRELPSDGWTVSQFSASTGLVRDAGLLGGKGYVPEEFVEVPAPGSGEEVIVRTIVEVAPGDYDLVVSAATAKSVHWNGIEVGGGDGYSRTARVVAQAVNVLEYRTGSVDPPGPMALGELTTIRSAFLLVEPDGYGRRPEFMTIGSADAPVDGTTFTRRFSVPANARSARLIVGAATGLDVNIDGAVIARQEKVEYYEGSWGANPMFFEHDVTGILNQGDHTISIVTDSVDSRDVVFVDLVIETAAEPVVIVSGEGWDVESGGIRSSSREHRGHWGELISAHAATRTHPLRDAEWLNGPVAIGAASAPVRARTTLQPEEQRVRALLPSGTRGVSIPALERGPVLLDGRPITVSGAEIAFDQPLDAPGTLEFITKTGRLGGALTGPLVLSLESAPITLQEWSEIGLGSWSGGVEYTTSVDLDDAPAERVLDLGALRGSVSVTVDGEPVGSRFCAPWTIPLGRRSGRIEVAVMVFNTLAPFLHASTPTTWAFPSQFASGLFGPVAISTVAD